MSRNGSGNYSLPAGNPVVSGTTISSTWANTTLSDIASALTDSVAADGQTPMSGSLNMTDHLINNVANPSTDYDAANKIYVDSAIAIVEAEIAAINSVIPGSIQMWPTATAPTGYLLCAGTAVSRTTYAALFAVIGTTFGVGDGSTTFNLPNYTNRMPIGVGSTAALAATGGSKDAVVVSHTHTATVTDPTHNHTIPMQNGYVTYNGGPPIGGSGINYYSNQAATGISVSNSTTGVSGTDANLPPYLGINFIIKV